VAFSNSAVVKYPVEEVFSIFIKTAKRDFPKFNESNPIGSSVIKKVGAYSVNSANLKIEITDYKINELYQLTSTGPKTVYYSNYKFEKIDENSTRITLIEEDVSDGFITWLNRLIQGLAFSGRVKRRFIYFIETLEREIERMREKLEKNSKSRSDEEKKINEKAQAKKAKEIAMQAEKEAKEARVAAEKAMAIADMAEKAAAEAVKKAEVVEFDIEKKESVEVKI
jgi:hypothetical protein